MDPKQLADEIEKRILAMSQEPDRSTGGILLPWKVKAEGELLAYLNDQAANIVDALRSPQYVWQPISSAPKDGTSILLLVPTTFGKWNMALPLPGRWEERDPPSSGFWLTFNHDEAVARNDDASHWMPLPDLPSGISNPEGKS